MKTEEHYGLEFYPGGKLIKCEWVYDEEKKEGHYEKVDITRGDWIHERDRLVYFHRGVTLNDVFSFVSLEPEKWDIILTNCFVKEFIDVWKNIDKSSIDTNREYDPDKIEYLELYWAADIFAFDGSADISGLSFPSFHGIGFELKEEPKEEFSPYKKGDRINWGLDFSELNSLLNLEIKLNEELEVMEEWTIKNSKPNTLLKCNYKYNLTQVLQGIFWEISFYGSPKEKVSNV